MSLFSKVNHETDQIQEETDSLGGRRILDTGVYPVTVEMAYLKESKGGAIGVVLDLVTDDGANLSQTIYVTSGTAKGCKTYYETANGEKRFLPGYNLMNSLALLTCDKELFDLEPEQKVIKVYSREAQDEVPTKVDVLTELLGQKALAAVFKQVVDKNVQADDGSYVPSGETREENEIDKFFHAEQRKTVTEFRNKAEEASFIDAWLAKWEGQVKDKTDKSGAQGKAGAPKAAGGGVKKPTKSLFGN